jgi:hypothetical protein
MLLAARGDRFRVHPLTDRADDAEVILFVGAEHSDFWDVRRHPLVRRFREKCFLFDSSDQIIPYLPGVYANIERAHYEPGRVRSGFYLRVFENDHVRYDTDVANAPWLFSFVGAVANARVRKCIARLRHPRGLIRDSTALAQDLRRTSFPAPADYQSRYAETLRQSKFVLCPRGFGASSWRLFETMKAGRVPVIISDAWVPPEGPAWDTFSLRVTENNVERVPCRLQAYEDQAPAMAAEARRQWEQWFSEDVAYHRVVEWCLAIRRYRALPEAVGRWRAYMQLLRPFYFRHHVLGRLRQLIRSALVRSP